MIKPFREHHLLTLMQGYEQQRLPLDLYISYYFKEHKALGSKDRGWIAENAYSMIRWQALLDYIGDNPSMENKVELLKTFNPNEWINKEEIPLHIRCSFPKGLFDLIVDNYGIEKGKELCLINNTPAPTTVRVNTLKGTREELMVKWKDLYEISPCEFSKEGIIFHKKISFFTLPEFKQGLFEVQDEGSQLVAQMVKAKPGQWALDYCAGSGGKTLAFAPGMEKTGQIFLHDSRPHALEEARKRLRRAGIQNAQVVLPDDPKLKKLKKKMDWVLVDAPCSGTGTMRRNPDMKWNFTEEGLKRLTGLQRTIFEKALSFLKPDGFIVYATCSLLKEENQNQLEHFLKTYPLVVEGTPFQSLPSRQGMDGFYSVCLKFSNE